MVPKLREKYLECLDHFDFVSGGKTPEGTIEEEWAIIDGPSLGQNDSLTLLNGPVEVTYKGVLLDKGKPEYSEMAPFSVYLSVPRVSDPARFIDFVAGENGWQVSENRKKSTRTLETPYGSFPVYEGVQEMLFIETGPEPRKLAEVIGAIEKAYSSL